MSFDTHPTHPSFAGLESDAILSSLLAVSMDGIFVLDEQLDVVVYNPACELIFGYSPLDVVGRSVSNFLDASVFSDPVLSLEKVGGQAPSGFKRDVLARHQTGRNVPVELSVGVAGYVADYKENSPRLFVCLAKDVSSQHETEKRLHELQEDLIRLARVSALDEMGSALAHELNQPLTAIILYLQAISSEFARARSDTALTQADERIETILAKARRESQRAGAIIQNIRNLVEKREPVRKLSELNLVVEDAIELTVPGKDKNIEIVKHFQSDLPLIMIDQVQIQQVVFNLVRNACEAVRELAHGVVTISTRVEGGYAALVVQDNGAGIRDIDELFKAFKTSKSNGMGLGLTISRTITQNHGGELIVDAGGVDEFGHSKGATFCVKLPLKSI